MDAEDRFTDSEDEESKIAEVIHDEPLKRPSAEKKQLVSYCDDPYDDTSSEKEEVKSIASEVENAETTEDYVLDKDEFPEPKGSCDPQLQEKITKMMTKMKETDCDWNIVIQNKKSFRNPSIYEKLIEFCGINEFGTNYRSDIYDPNKWGKGSFYDELYEAQKLETEKRKERQKAKVVFGAAKPAGISPGSANQVNKEDGGAAEILKVKAGKKRKKKTKWEPATKTLAIPPMIIKPTFNGIFQRMVFIKKP